MMLVFGHFLGNLAVIAEELLGLGPFFEEGECASTINFGRAGAAQRSCLAKSGERLAHLEL